MRNKYRLIISIFVLGIVYFIVMILNKSDIYAMVSGIVQAEMLKTSLPSYSYFSKVEDNCDFSIMSAILNDIYPINEYLLANENSESNIIYDSDNNDENNKNDDISSTTKGGEDTSKNNIPNSENATVQSTTQNNENNNSENTQSTTQANNIGSNASEEVKSAISRNVITGNVFSKENLIDYNFTHNNFYTVTSITSLTSQILRPAEFLEKNMTISHNADTPQILIFHTHSQETFADSVEGDVSTTIVGVGDYLTTLLTEKYGYNVIHDTSVYDYVDGKLDRSKAYTYAENGIANILNANPSIDVVIDLHRDGVAETTRLVTNIDGKDMAKVMLFNGLSYSIRNGDISYLYNPYRDDNLAMSLQMYLLGQAYYPDYFRRIYVNAYRYCLHERGKSMLIEAGAQTNTFQEVKNAMEPLADLLDKLLRGEKAYS